MGDETKRERDGVRQNKNDFTGDRFQVIVPLYIHTKSWLSKIKLSLWHFLSLLGFDMRLWMADVQSQVGDRVA